MALTRKQAILNLATWFGCGLSPRAPGTVGSFGALPLHMVLRYTHPLLHATLVTSITLAGIWCANEAARELGQDDPQCVVIDEVAGVLIALGLVRGGGITAHAVAFALFRTLDILKPGPVARAERAKPAGLGIMLDDIVAGFMAGLATRSLR